MRDPELLIKLLGELAAEPTGRKSTFGRGAEGMRQIQHYELLADVGHAEWRESTKKTTTGTTERTTKERSSIRITAAGYDFVEALGSERKGEEVRRRFLERMKDGAGYAKAAADAVKVVADFLGLGA